MPDNEKEYEASLFVDEAVKQHAEYALEAIARALSGSRKITLSFSEEGNPFLYDKHEKGDNGVWIVKTDKYRIKATIDEFTFYGNSAISVWIKIIDFWAGDTVVFPCGAAQFGRIKEVDSRLKEVDELMDDTLPDIKIEDLDLSPQATFCLRKNGIVSLEELSKMTTEEFMNLGLGKKVFNEMTKVLSLHNLSWKCSSVKEK